MGHLKYAVFVGALALAGCGSNTTSFATAPIGEQTVGTMPTGVTVTYNETADTFVVSDGGSSQTLINTGGQFNGYTAYQVSGATTDTLVLRKETTAGDGFVQIILSPDFGSGLAAAEYGRTAATAVPTAGSANYAGTYVGALSVDGLVVTGGAMTGDIALSIDFDASTVSGGVTNRTSASRGDFDDIALASTTLGAGSFDGTTSGGGQTGGAAIGAGTYHGLLSGPNGGTALGAILLTQSGMTGLGGTVVETGTFIAE